ncbi:MAG: HEAT repeat domain-containing protein [Actinomycetota bacterium]
MSVYTAFLLAGLALVALGLVLAAAIVLQRSLRQHAGRRDLALVEPFRPLLIALVMDDRVDAAATAQILGADDRAWSALEPHIISMVRKLRGDSRAVLVNLLDERGTITRLNRRLKRPGAVGRARAAELLGLLGEHAPRRDLERLALRDHDAEVRIVAARALGEIGDPMSARALLAAASGPRAVPLRIAARSLARLGPGAAPELMRGLRSEQTTSRAVSAEILGLLGVTAAAPALAGAAEDDAELDVRIRSARALGRIGVPSALPVLERCTGPDRHPALRAVAARAVGEVGGPIAIELLARLMDDPAHRVAANAARALGRLGDRALPALRRTASGPTPGAPYAAEVLAELDVRSGRVVALRVDVADVTSDVREHAASRGQR